MSGSSTGAFAAGAAAIDYSQVTTKTINDARIAVRLVASDGDVVWSTTQESKGAKFKGAAADVADKVAKQLLSELEKSSPAEQKTQPDGQARFIPRPKEK